MSEENKIVEINDEKLAKVTGGTGDGEPKYQTGHTYVSHSGFFSCLVEVKSFKEKKDNINYYNVEYRITRISKVGPGQRGDLKQTVLTEEQITREVYINW